MTTTFRSALLFAVGVLTACVCLSAQTPPPPPGNHYGGATTGLWITLPSGAAGPNTPGGPVVVVDPPVFPGGPGTAPDTYGEENGWNHSKGSLSRTNDTTNVVSGSKAFAKLQTFTLIMPPAPHEHHWAAQGSAKVGGYAKARLLNAHGTCHAAASSKTDVIYGGQTVRAEDTAGVALTHAGSHNIGGSIQISDFGLGFSLSYAAASTSEAIKPLADQKTGTIADANSAVIDYTQKGDMAYSFQAEAAGDPASADVEAQAKGSATIIFFLISDV